MTIKNNKYLYMKQLEILDEKSVKFLEKYLNNASPTGYEWDGQKIWMKYLEPYVDEFITDTYGTAVGVINPKAKFKVVIEGHADEISWYVNYTVSYTHLRAHETDSYL